MRTQETGQKEASRTPVKLPVENVLQSEGRAAAKSRSSEAGRNACGPGASGRLGITWDGERRCVLCSEGGAGHSGADLGGGGGASAARVLFPTDHLDFPEASSLELQISGLVWVLPKHTFNSW